MYEFERERGLTSAVKNTSFFFKLYLFSIMKLKINNYNVLFS